MPELLEYGRPTVRDQREIVLGTILGTGAGIVLTIVIVGGVVLRDSPQSDLVASFLLPYAMLAAPAVTKAPWIYWPVIGFALAQYPVYGGYCGAGLAKGRFWRGPGIIAGIHGVAAAAAVFAYL